MESAYASTFLTTVEPSQAATILRDRVHSNHAIAEDLAEWFRELQTIEQTYCRSLGKLASRLPITDIANMGIMEKPWRRTIDGINTLATNHSKFATKLTHELINPLSQYDKTPENGNMGMLERNLTQISRDLESAEARVSKAEQSKSKNKSSKQTDAQDDLRKSRSRWDSESPNTFEKLQQVDEARIAFLRDALVKYETSSIDLYSAQIQAAESAIAHLLEVNPTDEPMDFVGKRLSQSSALPTSTRPPAPGLSRTLSQGDTGSVRSSGGATSSLKSKFGTLLKGRRSGSPNKRQSMMGSFGTSSVNGRQKLPEMREEPEAVRPSTQTTSGTGFSNGAYSEAHEAPEITASPQVIPTQVSSEMTGEPYIEQHDRTNFSPIPTSSQTEQPSEIQPSLFTTNESSMTSPLQNSLRNVNIRSTSYTNTSTEEDLAAMDKVSSSLRAQPTVSRRARGRRDVRGSVYSPAQNEASQVAHDVLGSPLPQISEPEYPAYQAQTTTAAIPTNFTNRTDALNRQDTGLSQDGADSIRSSRSNTSALPSNRHTEPTSDGLHLSVIETISVSIDSDGRLSNFTVNGEAAIANRNPIDFAPLQLQIQSPDTIDRLVANNHLLKSSGEQIYEFEASAAPTMTTLFKYQVHPDAARQSRFMPIVLNQKWSTEENQTSVKLAYRLNPLFGAGSLTLQDVEVSVAINGSANSCVAKPSGTFVKRSNKLVWRLSEVTLQSGAEGVLLARFKTNAACQPTDSTEIKFKTLASNIARGSGFGVYATRSKNNPFDDSPTIENVMVQSNYVLQSGNYTISTKST